MYLREKVSVNGAQITIYFPKIIFTSLSSLFEWTENRSFSSFSAFENFLKTFIICSYLNNVIKTSFRRHSDNARYEAGHFKLPKITLYKEGKVYF